MLHEKASQHLRVNKAKEQQERIGHGCVTGWVRARGPGKALLSAVCLEIACTQALADPPCKCPTIHAPWIFVFLWCFWVFFFFNLTPHSFGTLPSQNVVILCFHFPTWTEAPQGEVNSVMPVVVSSTLREGLINMCQIVLKAKGNVASVFNKTLCAHMISGDGARGMNRVQF